MKLLIVDDHAVVREGIAALLQQAHAGSVIVQARDLGDAIVLATAHADLDAVLLDLRMPGVSGTAAIAELARRFPAVPIIVLSSSEDPAEVRAALAAGALGYVPKSARPQALLSALQIVLAGEIYVPPLMLAAVSAPPMARASEAPAAAGKLTERQLEVLDQLVLGLSNKDIGHALALSEKTVKAHVTAIFRALQVVNRTQAARVARQRGLVRAPAAGW